MTPDRAFLGELAAPTPESRAAAKSSPPIAPRISKTATAQSPAATPSRDQFNWMAVGLSVVVHCILLTVLALLVIRGAAAEPEIDALIQSGSGSGFGGELGEPVGLNLEPMMPVGTLEGGNPQMAAVDIPLDGIGGNTGAAGPFGSPDGGVAGGRGGAGHGDAGDGFPGLPGRAVRAGSFAAWTTPQGLDNHRRRFKEKGKPGDSPQPGEIYHITIQIRLPADRKIYALSDLSGEVVGTDRYRQRFPQRAWITDADGELVRPPSTGKLKVKNRVVEIIIEVPGAARLVEDTIEVESKLLKEQQTLTLTFEE
jgi:hypothetical protein